MNNKISEKVQSAGLFLNKNADKVAACMMATMVMGGVVFAAPADALWSTIAGLLETWVTRLGGVIMFVGGVMFGLGWQSNDASQKSNGIQTIVAGAIVIAVAQLTSTFFA